MKSVKAYLIAAVILGICGFILTLAFGTKVSTIHTEIGYVLGIIVLVVAAVFGRFIRSQGGNPWLYGAVFGAIVGFLESLGGLFVKLDSSTLNPSLTAKQLHDSLLAAELAKVITTIVAYALMGLIVAGIGSAPSRRERQRGHLRRKPKD